MATVGVKGLNFKWYFCGFICGVCTCGVLFRLKSKLLNLIFTKMCNCLTSLFGCVSDRRDASSNEKGDGVTSDDYSACKGSSEVAASTVRVSPRQETLVHWFIRRCFGVRCFLNTSFIAQHQEKMCCNPLTHAVAIWVQL